MDRRRRPPDATGAGGRFDRIRVQTREFITRDQAHGHGHPYTVAMDWHLRLHQRLGAPWPCAWTSDFERLWEEVAGEMADLGLPLERGTYGG